MKKQVDKKEEQLNIGALNSTVTPITAAISSAAVGYRGKTGNGIAFENASHIVDKISGKNAVLIGDVKDPNTGHIIEARRCEMIGTLLNRTSFIAHRYFYDFAPVIGVLRR